MIRETPPPASGREATSSEGRNVATTSCSLGETSALSPFMREGDSNKMKQWKPLVGWKNVRKISRQPPHTHTAS